MSKRSTIEKLAVPMFVSGILAMIGSAFISLGAAANATSPVQYKQVTITYLSSGYSASDSSCGSSQNYYGYSTRDSFRAKYSNSSSNQKTFLCTATVYVVDEVTIPTPKPVPTVTLIYEKPIHPTPTYTPRPTGTPKPTNTPRPTPSYTPTQSPKPVPTVTPRPTPSFTPIFTPSPRPTLPIPSTRTP
ncbi:MAG: hypothetical protein RJA78_402 [Actinomycetota bacterium]|jgi:hypothetical protein